MPHWPTSRAELVAVQDALARSNPPPWEPPRHGRTGACFVCFQRGGEGPGAEGDSAWAGAVAMSERGTEASAVVEGEAAAPYEASLLALREGALLEAVVRELAEPPDVLLVDATGRDHPRRAGLALHLGAVVEIPTVGVTHRTLVAAGEWPRDEPGERSPLTIGTDLVGYWLQTRHGTRPLAVHAAWRTDAETAVEVVLGALRGARTPEPLREARRLARSARAAAGPAGRR
ncbi:MAG: endonuclease V [Actinomycetota bacterium]|nr:endonuclease V [Actinomycetota bacterium]